MLEDAGGGDLHQRKLPDNSCKVTFAQVLAAIKYMHNINVIHRDLKAENVLFSGAGCVKVADFGFSTQVSHGGEALDTFCGSPPYAAPELFRDECYLGAAGVLLFFMPQPRHRCLPGPAAPGPEEAGLRQPPRDPGRGDGPQEGGAPGLQGPQTHLQIMRAVVKKKHASAVFIETFIFYRDDICRFFFNIPFILYLVRGELTIATNEYFKHVVIVSPVQLFTFLE